MERKSKVEILNYVKQYFETHQRAVVGTECCYLTDTGLMCSHSICLNDDFDRSKILSAVSADELIDFYGDQIHKPEFRGHSKDFWLSIQRFHDEDSLWKAFSGGNILTEFGRDRYNMLLEKFNNPNYE
jgi:hypothetical protein